MKCFSSVLFWALIIIWVEYILQSTREDRKTWFPGSKIKNSYIFVMIDVRDQEEREPNLKRISILSKFLFISEKLNCPVLKRLK